MDRRLVTVNLDDRDAGLMVDIGEAGLAVQALARIKPGATTTLQFELPDTSTRIEATGTVAWVDPGSGRAGIHFETVPEAVAASLKEWLGVATVTSPAPPALAVAAMAAPAPPQEAAPGKLAETVEIAAPAIPPSLTGESKVAEIAALQREITSRGLERDAALALTAERARELTRADGVAILLGNSDRMTCQASSGAAPPVGVDLQPDSGVSGECVRTGVTVRCEDTEFDPRVDREACRALNLRSAVVVPLFSRGNISGLVEVFYGVARGFEGRDVLTLRRIADLVSATLCAPASKQALEEEAQAPVVTAPPVTPPLIPPAPRLAAEQVACAVCGHMNLAAASECENCHFSLRTDWSDSSASGARRWLRVHLRLSPRLLALIVILLLLLAAFGWLEYKSRRESPPPSVRATLSPRPAAPGVRSRTGNTALIPE